MIRHINRSHLKRRWGRKWTKRACPCCGAGDDYNRERQRRNLKERLIKAEIKDGLAKVS